MIEIVFLIAGLAFSLLVYQRSIRAASLTTVRKAVYFLFTFIGITGMVFLFGIMASFLLNGMK